VIKNFHQNSEKGQTLQIEFSGTDGIYQYRQDLHNVVLPSHNAPYDREIDLIQDLAEKYNLDVFFTEANPSGGEPIASIESNVDPETNIEIAEELATKIFRTDPSSVNETEIF
jgi:hypothetical protein